LKKLRADWLTGNDNLISIYLGHFPQGAKAAGSGHGG